MPSTNLVGHWELDESVGMTATDSVGSQHGTLPNFPGDDSQWTTSRLGGALQFDGDDDYVAITGYSGVTGTQSRTVTAWIKTSKTGIIFSWGNNVPQRELLTFRSVDPVISIINAVLEPKNGEVAL